MSTAGAQIPGKETRNLDAVWLKFKAMPEAVTHPKHKETDTRQGFSFWGQQTLLSAGTCRGPTFLPRPMAAPTAPQVPPHQGWQPAFLKRLWPSPASSQWTIAHTTEHTATAGNPAGSPWEKPRDRKSHRDYRASARWPSTCRPAATPGTQARTQLLPMLICISSMQEVFWF